MPTPMHLKASFYPECYYHIVCKSIDGLLLFTDEIDFRVFKERFHFYTSGFIDVYSYSLLNNHTHHVVKVKSLKAVEQHIITLPDSIKTVAMNAFLQNPKDEKIVDQIIERQMNSFLVSFARYVNGRFTRKGGLFQKPFKRVEISGESHLQQAIIYVHANVQKHGLLDDFKLHTQSSYKEIINRNNTFVQVEGVINFFGTLDKLQNIHQELVNYFYRENWPNSKLE